MGPFCVLTLTFPPLPVTLTGPLTACASTVPVHSLSEMGPFFASALIVPEESRNERGPFSVRAVTAPEMPRTETGPLPTSRSRFAPRGARTMRYTSQSRFSGPRRASSPSSKDTEMRARSCERAAALQAVTEKSRRSLPWT